LFGVFFSVIWEIILRDSWDAILRACLPVP
jgi:hypothetical protein